MGKPWTVVLVRSAPSNLISVSPCLHVDSEFLSLPAPHGFDQYAGDFGAAELRRGDLAGREHLAHPGAAERHVLRAVMRAGFRRGHGVARLAEERVVEEQRRDP